MKLQSNERGEMNALVIPLILLSLLFVGAAGFALWAFNGRQDYENNVDHKVTVAVNASKQTVQAADAVQYAEAAKQPLKTYVGPSAFGSVHISFPKTWSAYIKTDDTSNPLNGYFFPDAVPSIDDQGSAFALRVQVAAQSYDQILGQFTSQQQQGTVTIVPYSLPKVSSVVGVRVTGQISQTKQGSMVILPIRDKTLQIWTEAATYLPDFNNNVLPNTTFSP